VASGSAALKAMALDASAVSLGQPYIYGLALGGEQGVRAVVDNFLADLDLALALNRPMSLTSRLARADHTRAIYRIGLFAA